MLPLDAVLEIASRLKDPEQASGQNNARLDPWNPLSLGKGFPGVVMFYAELDRHFPDDGWDHVAHQYLVSIQKELEAHGIPDMSLFSGLAGVAYAVRMASRDGSRYRNLLQKLDDLLARNLSARIPFELVQGQIGIGAYLMVAKHPSLEPLLQDLVKRLSIPIQVDGMTVPGWYRRDPRQVEQFPNGLLDCGMAHGAAGAVAFLAIALKSGFEVSGQRDVLKLMVDWLQKWKHTDEWGPYWPEKIACENENKNASVIPRAAWCYGNTGFGRALELSSQALGDAELHECASQALYSVFQRPGWDLISPTLCHGYAGLLHVTVADEHRRGLVESIMSKMDTQVPFGIRHTTRQNTLGYDHCGFLDGAAGVGLELLAHDRGTRLPWDRVLLLN